MQSFEDLRRMLRENYQQVVQPFATPVRADSTTVDADDPTRAGSAAPPPSASQSPEPLSTEETAPSPAPQTAPPSPQSASAFPTVPTPAQHGAPAASEELGAEAVHLRPSPLEVEEVRAPSPMASPGAPASLVVLALPAPSSGSPWPSYLNAQGPCRWCGGTTWMPRKEDGRWMCACYFGYAQASAALAARV